MIRNFKNTEIFKLFSLYGVKSISEESENRPISVLLDNVNRFLDRGIRFDQAISILKHCLERNYNSPDIYASLAVACALRAFSLSYAMTQKHSYTVREAIYNQSLTNWKKGQADKDNILFGIPAPQQLPQIVTLDDNKNYHLSLDEGRRQIMYLSKIVYICYEKYLIDKMKFNEKDTEKIGWSLLILWKHPNRMVPNLLPSSLKPEMILDIIEMASKKHENEILGLRRYANACLLMGRYEPLPLQPKFEFYYDYPIYRKGISILELISKKEDNDIDLLIHICVIKSWISDDYSKEKKVLSGFTSHNFISDMICMPILPNINKIKYISINNFDKKITYNHDSSFLPSYVSFINNFLNWFWQSIRKIVFDFDDSLLELLDDFEVLEKKPEKVVSNMINTIDYIFKILKCVETSSNSIDIRNDATIIELFSLKRIGAKIDSMNTSDGDLLDRNKAIKRLLSNRDQSNKVNRAFSGR